MSLYDYKQSMAIACCNYPFYALIMTAMRQADSDNIELLKSIYPEIWDELYKRYHAPAGKLETD